MKWESKVLAANQMISSCLCFFKIIPSPSWIFVVPASLISLLFATYLVPGFGFLSVLLYTSLVLVFSTIFCICTASKHQKAVCDFVCETKSSMVESSDQREDIAEPKEEEKEEEEEEDDNNGGQEKASSYAEESSDQRDDITEAKDDDEDNSGGGSDANKNNYSTRSPDSLSNSEAHHQEMSTSEESDELDCYWPLDRSVDGSDGSISDEESLIEIALPTGHLKHQQQQQQQSLMMMELLAEYNFDMNEEDNLIEIDISMGSIKSYSSRFEIQA
ncbi:kinesin-related protein 6-like [Neltuma alba]|uniref:kinesin-related protein 6-like n=1 Tax=Neltuma alba TaxID=207710 RepID=UPI0010A434A3|nr:kinesin-related protein 6-like [Prosopis alba]